VLRKEIIEDTLGVILKYQDDVQKVSGKTTGELLERIGSGE